MKILKKFLKFVSCDNEEYENCEVFEDQLPCENNHTKPVFGEQGSAEDQLSVKRGINVHMSLANGFTKKERLEGLHFEVADRHAAYKFLEVGISGNVFLSRQDAMYIRLNKNLLF